MFSRKCAFSCFQAPFRKRISPASRKVVLFSTLSLLVALCRGVGAFHSLNESTESKEARIRFFKETIFFFAVFSICTRRN